MGQNSSHSPARGGGTGGDVALLGGASQLTSRSSTYIADRIKAAAPGETVTLPDGVYHEDVIFDKAITLRGRDRDNCIIIATSQFGFEFTLESGEATLSSLSLLAKGGEALTITGKGVLTVEYWYGSLLCTLSF